MSKEYQELLVHRLEQPLLEGSLNTQCQELSLAGGKTFSLLDIVHKGPYGSLISVKNIKTGEHYLWKFSNNKNHSLKNEAYLQDIAHKVLVANGFPWAVPTVEDIFFCKNYGVGFLMKHVQNANIFSNYLEKHFNWSTVCKENDLMILEIIIQLAGYLQLLENTLAMNHRDLKSKNVILIESEEKKFTFTIKTKMKNYSLTTNHKAILVDFGFACANVDSEIVAAGNYLPTFDGCPKVGRDMFLFLSNLWNVEVLRSKLTAGFQKWICNRLQTEKKSWSSYLENTKDPFMKLIYLFTTSSGFYVHECSPQRILETIADEFPEILKIS